MGIFVNELSHPPKGSWAVIENAISKAYDIKIYDEDYYKLDLNFNHIFGSVKKSFIKLDKSLKYIPIFAVIDDEPQGVWGFKLEYAYLTSKKTDLSFLLYSDSYNMDETIYPVKVFKEITKNKKEEIPKLILSHYKKNHHFGTHLCNEILLNNDYKWDLKYLKKLFNKSHKKRKQMKKENEKPLEVDKSLKTLDYPESYYNIFIYKMNEKQFKDKVTARYISKFIVSTLKC